MKIEKKILVITLETRNDLISFLSIISRNGIANETEQREMYEDLLHRINSELAS